MRFDLTDLRVFLHTCSEGSMTAAGERAHLTLAAVSARIRAMEDSLGIALLDRHARGVSPTAAGRVLAAHAQAMLQQLDVLHRDLSGTGARDQRVVLLANSSAIARPLGAILAPALVDRISLRFEVRESPSDVTVNALRAGIAGIGIVSDAADTQGLDVDVLGPDPLVVVMAASHPLSGRATIQFHELLAHDWVSWRAGGALHAHVALHALRAGGALRERAAVHGATDAITMAAAGIGITVLPAWIALGGAADVHGVVRPLDTPWARRHLLLCRLPGTNGFIADLVRRLRATWPE